MKLGLDTERLNPWGDIASLFHNDRYYVLSHPDILARKRELVNVSEQLALQGNYDKLLTEGEKLQKELYLYPAKDRSKMRGAMVGGWLLDAYGVVNNIADPNKIPRDKRLEQIINGKVKKQTFQDVMSVWRMMNDYKNGKNPEVAFAAIEKLSIFDNGQILGTADNDGSAGFDTKYQRTRSLILGLIGLDYSQLDRLFEFVGWERTSRRKMARLPAIQSMAIARNKRWLSEPEVKLLRTKSRLHWGSPGSGATEDKPKNIDANVWDRTMEVRFDHLVYKAKHGMPLVDLTKEIPLDYFRQHRDKLALLKAIRDANKNPGWQGPKPATQIERRESLDRSKLPEPFWKTLVLSILGWV